jgi:hypothetical protein
MIRVLRLIEYTYPDNETAEADMQRWGVPANGSKKWGKHDDKVIRSTIIIDLDPEPDDPQN